MQRTDNTGAVERPLRIVHVGLGINPIPAQDEAGGVERDIFCLTNHLTTLGCDVWIVDVAARREERLGARARFYEVPRQPVPGAGWHGGMPGSLVFSVQAAAALERLAAIVKPDVVNVHSPYFVLALRLICGAGARGRLVLTSHAPLVLGPASLKMRAQTLLDRVAFGMADHIIARTEASCRHIVAKHNLPLDKVSVIPVAVEMEVADRLLEESAARRCLSRTVLCVSRITPRKNQEALVNAAARVLKVFPDVRFVFAGPVADKQYYDRLLSLVRERGLSQWVTFTGTLPRQELDRLYAEASVFAFPTLAEMFPQALLEALSFGLPAVVSAIPANVEILGESDPAGLLVKPHDDEEIAEAILSLLGDDALRASLSVKARCVAERFSGDAVARQTLAVYQRLLRV